MQAVIEHNYEGVKTSSGSYSFEFKEKKNKIKDSSFKYSPYHNLNSYQLCRMYEEVFLLCS